MRIRRELVTLFALALALAPFAWNAPHDAGAAFPATASRCVFAQTADVTIASTTAETSLIGTGTGSVTLPANLFAYGATVRIYASGYVTDTVTPTMRWRVKFGSTTLVDSTSITMGTISGTRSWYLTCEITCRSTGASGSLYARGQVRVFTSAVAATSFQLPLSAAVTVDTTPATALDVTEQWGTLSALDSLTCTNLTVEVLP